MPEKQIRKDDNQSQPTMVKNEDSTTKLLDMGMQKKFIFPAKSKDGIAV